MAAAIAADAVPADSALRRVSPAGRLVIEAAAEHPGSPAGEIARRTGLLPGQVTALAQELAAAGFLDLAAGQDGDRLSVSQGYLFGPDRTGPVDQAVAAALGTAGPGAVAEVTLLLAALARQLGTGRGLGAPGAVRPRLLRRRLPRHPAVGDRASAAGPDRPGRVLHGPGPRHPASGRAGSAGPTSRRSSATAGASTRSSPPSSR